MKTAKQLRKEINDTVKAAGTNRGSKDYRSHEKQVSFLKTCLLYIESGANEKFILHQIEDLERKMDAINSGYSDWLKNTPGAASLKSPLTTYNSLMRLSTIKKQLKTLGFLLR